jgi:hypothetical protein
LNYEHTQIAYPGQKLCSGYPDSGMDVNYFKEQNPSYTSSPDWDFTNYTPSIVVINLGQNDGNHVPDNVFQSTYTTFLANLRAKFPDAEIYAMRTFGGLEATTTLDTAGWLSSGDYVDTVHPTNSGQIKAANRLAPILAGTPAPYYFQTEDLTVQSFTSGLTHRIITDPSFVGGLGTILDATGIGNQVTYVLPGESA